jgi:hypothetical protein
MITPHCTQWVPVSALSINQVKLRMAGKIDRSQSAAKTVDRSAADGACPLSRA